MADDTFPVTENTPFHPTDTPRGTLYYNLEELTDKQQIRLNSLKIDTIREDHKYLAANPEIRAIIALVLRKVLRHRPIIKIHEFIAKFFNRSTADIQDEIFEYLDQKDILSSKEVSQEYFVIEKKSAEKKELNIGRTMDIICSEECTCEHAVGWKLPDYIPFDDMSFKETEHWLTPKTSKTSMIIDETSQGITSGDFSFFSELAQVIDLDGSDEEGTEAPISIRDDDVYVEPQPGEHIALDSSDQAILKNLNEQIITENQILIEQREDKLDVQDSPKLIEEIQPLLDEE